jgi:hypothetical protein
MANGHAAFGPTVALVDPGGLSEWIASAWPAD